MQINFEEIQKIIPVNIDFLIKTFNLSDLIFKYIKLSLKKFSYQTHIYTNNFKENFIGKIIKTHNT